MNNSSTFTNAGSVIFQSGLSTDNGTVFDNSGIVTVAADFVPNGTVLNSGRISVGGSLTTNSGAEIRNNCSIVVAGGFTNNANLQLAGTIVIGATASFVNQGRLTLDVTGAITGGSFTNNSQVSGAGRFFFTGNTLNQGPFNGVSPASPLNFFDSTQTTGGIFDTNNSTVTNTIRQSFTPPDGSTVSPGCAGAGADVSTTKTGPATITAGATLSYVVTTFNAGPSAATGIVVTDTLPAGVTVVSSDGGTVSAGTVTWNIASLVVGASQTFTLTVGTSASTTGPLLNVVRSTATTPDSNPGNNDGSAASARVTTTVIPAPPPNRPPVAINQERNTHTLATVVGVISASDPDAGQALTWQTTLVTPPTGGTGVIDPSGRFSYQATAAFTGIDFFEARVCDNGVPVLCAVGRVTLLVSPDPVPDFATTTANTPVTIPVSDNDIGPATAPVVIVAPTNGTATANSDRTITYTPDAGFTGLDTFGYRICAPTAPTVCDATAVTVLVQEPPNRSPVVGDVDVETAVDQPVTFDVPTSDPDPGQTVTLTTTPVTGPSNGSVVISPAGTVVYTPNPNFAGIDLFVVQGCDNAATPLCSTGTMTISVPPDAVNDVATTALDVPVTVDVRSNDRGTIGPPVVLSLGPAGAVAIVNPDGTITYTPPTGFTGVGQVDYQVCSTSAPALVRHGPTDRVRRPTSQQPAGGRQC